MNIKTLNEISSIVKQKTEGLYDISEWIMFIRERLYTGWGINPMVMTQLSFIQENDAHDMCYIVTVIARANIIIEDEITITQIDKEKCDNYYEQVADVSGIDKQSILDAFRCFYAKH